MKLLIIAQKVDVNDDNLGFFCRWLKEFGQYLEKVYAVGLACGAHDLPENITVYSLGKEKGYGKLKQFLILQKLLFQNLSKVDGVFVHMAPVFAALSYPLAKVFNKKLILWYAHGSVHVLLRLAEKMVDKIVTSSAEGCRLKSKKIRILGQGIDTDQFKPSELFPGADEIKLGLKILSVGRISPIKDQKTLIKAIDILVNQKGWKDLEIKIIGTPIEDYEKEYFEQLKELIAEKKLRNYIKFLGGMNHRQMPRYYQDADLFINTSFTGSMDKVVLEAMASGCLVLNCNEAYRETLDEKYMFRRKDSKGLAEKIFNLKDAPKNGNLRRIVIENHNLDGLIKKIIRQFNV